VPFCRDPHLPLDTRREVGALCSRAVAQILIRDDGVATAETKPIPLIDETGGLGNNPFVTER